jgi:hypothetical protein
MPPVKYDVVCSIFTMGVLNIQDYLDSDKAYFWVAPTSHELALPGEYVIKLPDDYQQVKVG